MKFNKIFRTAIFLGGVAASFVTVPSASAAVVYGGSSGSLSASATFAIVGGELRVVLANSSLVDVLVPTDVLTALFFNVSGSPGLSTDTATSDGPTYLGTSVAYGPGTDVGGEWAFVGGLSQYSANSGISSSGLGIFGPADRFNTSAAANLSGPASPDGLQFGLTSFGDNVATGNAAILGNELTKNSVTFLLNIANNPFSLNQISAVTFQYGTALDEGHFGGNCTSGCSTVIQAIPEPASIALLGLGLLSLALARRRRRQV